MKQPRPLKALAGLTDAQLAQLTEWVDLHSYRKAVELAQEKFGRTIPKTSLQRYIAHARAREVLDDSPQALEAAREINRFAADAQADFSTATLHLLERRAFDLALAGSDDKEDFQRLKDLLFLVQRHRSNDLQERKVQIQEEKLRRSAPPAEPGLEEERDRFSAIVDHVLGHHPVFVAAREKAAHEGFPPDPLPSPEVPQQPQPSEPTQSSEALARPSPAASAEKPSRKTQRRPDSAPPPPSSGSRESAGSRPSSNRRSSTPTHHHQPIPEAA